MKRALSILALLCLASLPLLGCDLGPGCPQTVDEAHALSFDDEVVAAGYAIRFIPSVDDPTLRGYDVNVTRPISEHAQPTTYFLRTDDEIAGIDDGQPVLLIGERTDRNFVLIAGGCPGLTPVNDGDLAP